MVLVTFWLVHKGRGPQLPRAQFDNIRQMASRNLNAAGPFCQICVTQSLTIETTAEGVEAEKQLDRCVEG